MLNNLTIKEVKEGYANKKFSSLDVVQSCLDQIKKTDNKVNAFVTVVEDEATEQAKKSDLLISSGSNLPLLGIPIAVKDNFSTKGIKTTASSKLLGQ